MNDKLINHTTDVINNIFNDHFKLNQDPFLQRIKLVSRAEKVNAKAKELNSEHVAEIEAELSFDGAKVPVLIDVYATWENNYFPANEAEPAETPGYVIDGIYIGDIDLSDCEPLMECAEIYVKTLS